jgi:hypothetical protein
LIFCAISGPSPNRARLAVTSRNASSMEIGCTCGVKRRMIAMTSRLACWYLRPSTGRNTPCGQRRPAVLSGIAEWTPNFRAS